MTQEYKKGDILVALKDEHFIEDDIQFLTEGEEYIVEDVLPGVFYFKSDVYINENTLHAYPYNEAVGVFEKKGLTL